MRESRRLVKNTGIIAIGNLSTKLVSFLLLPLYTSILSTSEYGIVDYIISLSIFLVPFISVLMDESMFRFLIDCETDEEKSKIISMSVIIILIGGIIFLSVAIPILMIIKYQYSSFLIFYILSSVLTTIISALLRGIGKTNYYAIFNFLTSIFNVLLNIMFIAVFYWGVQGMLSASIISQLSISSVFILKLKLWKYISFHVVNVSLAKEMVHYSIPLIPNKISWSIINLSARIIIMNSLGSNASGLYAVSYKFPNLMDTVYGFFYQSWKESSARVVGNHSQIEFYNKIYDYLKNFMFSLVIIMIAYMPIAFYFMVNKSFIEAIMYVPILLIATYFANISGFYGGIFTAYKDTNIMGTTTIVAAVINLSLNILFIGKIGLFAAAGATLLANYVVYEYRKKKVRKYIMLHENIKNKLFSIVICILVLFLFYSNNIIFIMLNCIISIAYAIFINRKLLTLVFNTIRYKI